MKSRARSTRRSAPACHSPISPVRSQPSAPLIARGRLRVVPIGLEEIGTLHQHFAIARKLDLPARGHGSHIARAGKRAALAANDAAGGFGLPVHFDDIDAEHLPERHGFRRQRRAGAEHELQLVEAELVEDRHEHARAAGAVERVVYKAHPAAPAPSRVTARKADREMRGPALDAAGVEDAEEHLRSEFLQVARHGEQNGRCRFEQGRRQVLRVLAEMRHEARDQRQRDGEIASDHVAERQIADRAVGLLRQRGIVVDDVRGRREMLAMGHQRAFGLTGGARGIDDEGGRVRVEPCNPVFEPGEIRFCGRREQRLIGSELAVLVGEHRGVIEHDDPLQFMQTIGNRQNLVDVFLIFRREQYRAAVSHLVF
jgi:hypothetical protein